MLVEEGEYSRIRKAAERQKLTLGEFVRRELRRSVEASDVRPAAEKLRVLQRASQYNFPTCDIEQMNAEIDQGYSHGLP